ncbi:MAG: PilN domain-containing protein [Phycisphaerales bacterium]
MSKPTPTQSNTVDRVAVVHRCAGSWHVALARRAAGPGGGVQLEQAQSLPQADVSGLCALLLRWRPGMLAWVVPSPLLVVRTIMGENGQPPAVPAMTDRGAFRSAMDLVAESQLGSSLGRHRRAAGVLDVAGAPLQVAIGWSGDLEPADHPARRRELAALARSAIYIPEVVALAGAIAATPGAAGVIATDRTTGSITVLAGHEGRSAVRVMRDDGEDAEMFSAACAAQSARVAGAVGIAAPRASGRAGGLEFFAADGRMVADRAGADASMSPVLRGAAVAVLAGETGVRPLLSMLPDAPVPHVPALMRAVDWFSTPSRGVAALAACLAIALLWPLGTAWARHRVLSDQAALSGTDDEAAADARKQAEFYSLLKEKRWPMTKLLGDLSASMPAGITLESMTVEYGQKVRITGSAESAQVVSEWREALDKSKVFDEVQVPRNEATTSAGTFDLTARVAQPLLALGSTEKIDPALIKVAAPAQPVNEPSRPAPAARAGAPSESPATGATRAGSTTRPTGGTRTARSGTTPEKPAADAVPPPISDEEIAQLDRSAAMREFASRSKASKSATEPEVVERLKAEAEKCKNQMQKAAGGGA